MRWMSVLVKTLLIISSCFLASIAMAQPVIVLNTELPEGAPNPGLYGSSVDIWQNLAVVGNSVSDSGGVYAYSRDPWGGWTPEGELSAPAIAELTHFAFGREIAVDDQVALVADPNAHSTFEGAFAGAAFIYRRIPLGNGDFIWIHEQRLIPDPGPEGRRFGISVAISGDTAMVGTLDNTVHVFKRNAGGPNQWGETRVLFAAPPTSFGATIALQGNTALIGAPLDTVDSESNAGRVFLYQRQSTAGTWLLEETLESPSPANGEQFGMSLDLATWSTTVGQITISTQRAIIGSLGKVYSWQKTTTNPFWVELDPLEDANLASFGSVAAGGLAEVHVRGFLNGVEPAVRSYARVGGNWVTVRTLLPNQGCCSFAIAVAAKGERIIIGDTGLETAFVYEPEIFADGFESGDLSRWSSTAP